MIRVVLAEDQSMLRSALAALLALEDDMEIIGEAADGQAALRLVRAHEPDVLVSDIEMPGLIGLELAAQLARDESRTRVLIITTFARPGYVQRARHHGVSGYLLKDTPSAELAAAIRTVASGGTAFDSNQLNRSNALPADPLNDRDRRILRLVEEGMSNKKIAAALNLSPGT
ncbi:MAG: response regulator transcription factor, partial [Xanthomonadales bacterium]|nr:response regulator transcription factor [Xanthomonadales bacterium]